VITHNCEQGTELWHKLRAGVITASNFESCTAKLKSGKDKGGPTKWAREYAFRLAIERISGQPLNDDYYETWAMKRGRELEEIARLKHEELKGILVDETGIALTDDKLFGASVDGLIGDDGCAEYKCFIGPSALMPILLDGDLSAIKAQMQGQMWVAERQWCAFGLYCPALEIIGKDLTIIEVERDNDYIEEMQFELLRFNNLVSEYINKLGVF